MYYVAGFDIGGTKLAVTLAKVEDGTMHILQKTGAATPREGYGPGLELLCTLFHQTLSAERLSAADVASVGICCGGPLDSGEGLILSPPNLPGWDNVPVISYFEKRLGIPTALQNDADACALAEWRFGAGRGTRNMIFLTFGTGFGAGLILNGALYSGSCGMAGEIGHCHSNFAGGNGYAPVGYGKAGSFEGYCSGGGIAELGRTAALECLQRGDPAAFCPIRKDLERVDAKAIADAAKAGDPTAAEIYACSGRNLGAVLALLIDLLNPEAVVIGSIFARSEELLRPAMETVVRGEALERSRRACKIVPAQLGERLGDVAALSVALSRVDQTELSLGPI